jgi:hypothetical protein
MKTVASMSIRGDRVTDADAHGKFVAIDYVKITNEPVRVGDWP